MSETPKKSTIQNIKTKKFNDEYKTWNYAVVLANQDEGFLSSKKEFTGGEEIEYTIEALKSAAEKDYNKIKLASANGFSGKGGGFQKSNPADNYPSFALSYGKDVIIAMMQNGNIPKTATSGEIAQTIVATADKFLKWLKENGK